MCGRWGGQRGGRSRCSDRDSIGPDKRVREEEGSKRPLGSETEDLRTDGGIGLWLAEKVGSPRWESWGRSQVRCSVWPAGHEGPTGCARAWPAACGRT